MVLAPIVAGAKLVLLGGAAIGLRGALGYGAFRASQPLISRMLVYIAIGMLVYDWTVSSDREMEMWEGLLVGGVVGGYTLHRNGVIL